jgi:uroporphyrinogen decarboxylase
MTKREVVKMVLDGQKPPYVPWHCGFTKDPLSRLTEHLGTADFDTALDNHFVKLGHSTGYVEPQGEDRYRDPFGVVWDRSIEQDIGIVEGTVLEEPTLDGYEFPDPLDDLYFSDIPAKLDRHGDCFRVYCIGFSLYERAWTLRGMENLLMDFYLNPEFMHELLDRICDYNIARVKKALTYDIDAVYFGDDWGQQKGLIMGPKLWREFIRPRVERMYEVTKQAGKYQLIHSCGDIHELIGDLVERGVNCINPFQPEALDVERCLAEYKGRVSFHGGLSTQKTLAHGTPEDVRAETRRLLTLGSEGGYIFAPAHAVERGTSLENMIAFLDEMRSQPGYRELAGRD